jgi:hypothetical protein
MVEKKKGICGYINKENAFVIDPVFEWAGCFSEGIAFMRVAGVYGYIAKDGSVIAEPQYQCAGSFSEGFASVYDSEFGAWVYFPFFGVSLTALGWTFLSAAIVV